MQTPFRSRYNFVTQNELPSKYTTPSFKSPAFPHAVQFKLHSYTPIFPWHSRKFHTYSELIFRGYSSRINWIRTKVSKQISRTPNPANFPSGFETFFDSYLNFSWIYYPFLTHIFIFFIITYTFLFCNKLIVITTVITSPTKIFRIIS